MAGFLIAICSYAQAVSSISGTVRNPVGWQAALDRAGFSPGVIDGRVGPKTRAAVAAFQAFRGLPATGVCDEETSRALEIGAAPAVVRHVITAADAKQVGPAPSDWVEKSKLPRLGYKSLAGLVAERGHCTIALLRRLNPKLNVDRLRVGDAVLIPNVAVEAKPPRAARLEIDLDRKIIRVLDAKGRAAALFHCSIARERSKRPNGPCRVVCITRDPEYLFDPRLWPEVKNVQRRLVIPPGPRNPVGRCWIGLSIDGYGIHGTPEPELIGKTGSHGCFRLTNWDALRLATMVRVGTEVRFTESDAVATRRGKH